MKFTFLVLILVHPQGKFLVDSLIHVNKDIKIETRVDVMRHLYKVIQIRGKYTNSLREYHLAIPHKLTTNGEFSTFHLPHFHDYSIKRFKERKKRSPDDSEMINYGVDINGALYHLELWPNRDFLHPSVVFERRDPTIAIKDRQVRGLVDKKLCHYTGKIKGIPNSKAALSTCDGLAGSVVINGKKFFIEPVSEHSPNKKGQHLHVVYEKSPKEKKSTCGTQESWEEAMKKRFREEALAGKDIFLQKRGLQSVYKYLELTVVCDKSFLKFHKSRDVELYVLTVMNMVSDYYHDASVGNQMDIVVVRVIYLEKEEEEIDLVINRDSGKTLRSFCSWAIKINTPVDSPNHHDMAVLLTRYDLCAEGEHDCDLAGLAFVGGACSKDEHCSVNEDEGLMLSVVAAHELGHLMGSEHDEQKTPCPVKDTDGSYFIMSPIVSAYTIRWSSCSRGMITALIDNNLAECLNDVPESTLYPFSNNMPGVVYDASEQCKFMFPASLGVCSGLKEKICEQLVCKMSATECLGKNQVPADGTKCGKNKWCFKKQCIEMGARPEAVNGGWGDWGPWSDCSRDCGGGVSSSVRECNNPIPANKGRFCLGERRKIKICNTTPCPDNAPSFRQQQCSEQDSKAWAGQYHTWSATFEKEKPCALFCLSEQNVLSQLEPVVKDGTPCKLGTSNMCISGVCRVVGCDYVLDSDAIEDKCGVCNGDGTQCKIVEETYKDVGGGYTKVVVIPSGVRRILIEEKAPSNNMIAISDNTEKKFYLNKDYTENQDGLYIFGKDEGMYSHVEPDMEKLFINGPLKEDLVFFVVFFDKENVGYYYKWSEPTIDSSYEPHYHWETGEYEDCSVLCGGGTQIATFQCMEERSGKVSSNFCAGVDKPKDLVKNCNEEPCKKKWKVGVWGRCRACRNKGGVRTRDVECVQENPRRGADDILQEDAECEGPKPGSVELCETKDKCNRKRMSSYIPGKYQDSIWNQMQGKHIRKRNKIPATTDSLSIRSQKHEVSVAEPNNTSLEVSTKYNINGSLGKMIHDYRPLDEQILIKYTIRPNPMVKNLSDKANAQMGDEVGDVIDSIHTKVFKGKVAAKLKHQLEHPSNTTFNITCHKKHKKNKIAYSKDVSTT